jgi:iron complex outermembrane receptor protein
MTRFDRSCFVVLATTLALPALAQTSVGETQQAAEPDSGIAEVVVTAQRREQKLQEVPLAVTALTTEQIENRGIDNVADLSALAPGLQISKEPTSSTTSQIAIRGLVAVNAGIYWDSPVGIYVDGVYIGKAQGGIFDVVDLDRVEVLRGPQGTLYGRNTLAGAINLITRKPSGEFYGSSSLEIGNYNAVVGKASVDLPKMGIVSLSLALRQEQRDGWVDTSAVSPVDEINNRSSNGLRLAADFDFAASLLGEYRFDRSNLNQTPSWSQLYSVGTGATSPFSPYPGNPYATLPGYASTKRLKHGDIDAPFYERAHIAGHSFTLSWLVDEHNTLKSISGYRRLDSDDSQDLDGTPLDVSLTQRPISYDQTSEDLQWLADFDRVNLVVGAYYFRDRGEARNPQRYFSGAVDIDSRYGTRTDALSGYGQLDYRLLEPLTLSAGIRYTREKKGIDRVYGCYQAFPGTACSSVPGTYNYLIPEGTSPSDTFSATTPMASVAYQVNEDINTYLRYAEGFKSGGFNAEFSNSAIGATDNLPETTTPFKPEKQRGFELGAKTSSFGKRLVLNAAGFYNKARDLQESLFLGGTGASSAIRNAGRATIYGAEFEGQFAFTRDSRLGFNYAYLHPEYDRFEDAASGTDQADDRAFPHAPRHSFNIYVDARLAQLGYGEVRGLIDYTYQSSMYTYAYRLDPPPDEYDADHTKVQGYGTLNARLSLNRIKLGERVQGELALWCRNLLDEDAPNNFIDFGASFGDLTIAYFNDPRTYGLTGIIRW